MENGKRSPVHEIVNALWRALHELGSGATTEQIEQWGFSIHAALSAAGREFHNHDHVVDLIGEGDALEVIAALYHDAVYIQVDLGPPRSMRGDLAGLIAPEMPPTRRPSESDAVVEGRVGWVIQPAAAAPVTSDVLAVFGRKVGDVVTPTTGLNELSSALVMGVQLHEAITREQKIAVAACIEQTIPFRTDCVRVLNERLALLGLAGDLLEETTKRAVRLGNRDVSNFSDNDAARFLDNTWKLLPESNPALHSPLVYTVHDYRIALQKMEQFLSWLPADRVFHTWHDEPKPEIHARRVARTAGNLELAVRYLRAKLYSIGIVEALADVTGGDIPVDYFMGGRKDETGASMRRIEQFLPQLPPAKDLDPSLHKLLAEGRASASSFDIGPSPLGAYLHATVGESEVMKGVEQVRRWWGGSGDAGQFLASQPAKPVAAIARAAANIIETRRDRLFALAERLER